MPKAYVHPLVCLTATCKVDDFADNMKTRSQESWVPCRDVQLIYGTMGLRDQSLLPPELWP